MYWPTVGSLVAAVKVGLCIYLHIMGFTTTKRYASACDSLAYVAAIVSRGSDSTLELEVH